MSRTRREYLREVGRGGGILVGLSVAGCSEAPSGSEQPTPVRIGSKPFTEQRILGYLALERLKQVSQIQVVDEIGYGNTLENWTAVRDGVKHLYWEYTGTAWRRLPPRRDERITDPQELYSKASTDASEQGIRMARPAAYSNNWVIAVTRAWSERTGVETISEFAAHVTGGNTDFRVAFNEDFYIRPDAWPGVADFYGIPPQVRQAIESGTFYVTSTGLTYELLTEGRVDVASGFATNPQLDRDEIVELADDQTYFIPYQPSPTAYAPRIEDHPVIFDALSPVVSSLDEATIRRLNHQVVVDGRQPQAVASEHLATVSDWGGTDA